MVKRNQHDGASSGGWWDDLPPAVRQRIARRTPAPNAPEPAPPGEPAPPAYRPAVLSDLVRLALLFIAAALANLLFLILALSFLAGRTPLGR